MYPVQVPRWLCARDLEGQGLTTSTLDLLTQAASALEAGQGPTERRAILSGLYDHLPALGALYASDPAAFEQAALRLEVRGMASAVKDWRKLVKEAAPRPQHRQQDSGSVWDKLTTTEDDKPHNTLENVTTILEADAHWVGMIRYCQFGGRVLLRGKSIRDVDESEIALWIAKEYGIQATTVRVAEAARVVADRNAFHPVLEWLDGLEWDGIERLPKMLSDLFGVQDDDLTRAMGRCFMISAIARVRKPGCKVDTTLVLTGPQGAKKSTAFRALAGSAWFRDTMMDIRNKDAYQQLQGVWIYELAELDSIRGRDNSAIKTFLATQEDHYRPSYGRNTVDQKRQCVFVGTTNESTFLNDKTGSRRFWVRAVTGLIDVDGIKSIRDQLWAEADHRYGSGEVWWLDAATDSARAEDAEQYEHEDPWVEPITAWLGGHHRAQVTVGEVLQDVLKLRPHEQDRIKGMRIAAILAGLGWEKGGRPRLGEVGDDGRKKKVRAWTRPSAPP